MSSLNERVQAWLRQNNIQFSKGDFSTFQPGDDPEQIGVWNTEKLGPQPSMAVLDAMVVPPPVPQSVTRRQARQALLLSGKLSQVQAAIDAIPDATQRGMIQIEWEDSLQFDRNRPSLIALATALGLSSADLDQLFIQAGALP